MKIAKSQQNLITKIKNCLKITWKIYQMRAVLKNLMIDFKTFLKQKAKKMRISRAIFKNKMREIKILFRKIMRIFNLNMGILKIRNFVMVSCIQMGMGCMNNLILTVIFVINSILINYIKVINCRDLFQILMKICAC